MSQTQHIHRNESSSLPLPSEKSREIIVKNPAAAPVYDWNTRQSSSALGRGRSTRGGNGGNNGGNSNKQSQGVIGGYGEEFDEKRGGWGGS